MKQLRLEQFKMEDAVNLTGCTVEEITPERMKKWAAIYEGESESYTIFFEDKVISCGGVRILWAGTGEAWIMLSQETKKYCRVHAMTKSVFEAIIEKHNLDRVHAFVRADKPEFLRYVEYMGFEREGLCKKFGPDGHDSYIYARVK